MSINFSTYGKVNRQWMISFLPSSQNINVVNELDEELTPGGYIHIRIRQRKNKKYITTIEGLSADLDLKRICGALKKNFNCTGQVVQDSDEVEVISLTGDQRQQVRDFLITEGIVKKEQVKVHGF
jgi:translation initiation factor 1